MNACTEILPEMPKALLQLPDTAVPPKLRWKGTQKKLRDENFEIIELPPQVDTQLTAKPVARNRQHSKIRARCRPRGSSHGSRDQLLHRYHTPESQATILAQTIPMIRDEFSALKGEEKQIPPPHFLVRSVTTRRKATRFLRNLRRSRFQYLSFLTCAL